MEQAQQLHIKESIRELKAIMHKQRPAIAQRIQMLITIQKQEDPLSKRALADLLGVNHNSVQKWRTMYKRGGINALLVDGRGGKRREVITSRTHKAIEKRLNSSQDAFRSYTELYQWVQDHYIPHIKYVTLNAYVKRHFGAKLKTARKSHILKDEQAVEAFKKNT